MDLLSGPIVGFDLETTGLAPSKDLPVEVGFAFDFPNREPLTIRFYVNPGISINPKAELIHGLSQDFVAAYGVSISECITQLKHIFGFLFAHQVPIAVMNARFDLTMVDYMFLKNGFEPLKWRNIIDPLVIVRRWDQDKTMSKNLKSLCERYGVEAETFHNATADAIAVARLARKLIKNFMELREIDSDILFLKQKQWHTDWANEFAAQLKEKGKVFKTEDFYWPTNFSCIH